MPTPIVLPSCLMDCYKVLFPKVDFSRVGFFLGLPFPVNHWARGGFTMCPGTGPEPDIHVYVDSYDPCSPNGSSEETFLTIGHELVHVVQIQGMIGGGRIPGSWTAYYTSHALGCAWRGSDCGNELEKEAYDYANGCPPDYTGGVLRSFVDQQLSGEAPCTGCPAPPSPTAGFVDALSAAATTTNPDLVKVSSNVGRTWCSLLTFPLDIIAGAFSIFGFSNTGGAIGAAIGAVAGGILGGILGAAGGPLGAVLGAFLGSILGAVIGGGIGSAIQGIVDTISSWF
jgi:hypothetical protein